MAPICTHKIATVQATKLPQSEKSRLLVASKVGPAKLHRTTTQIRKGWEISLHLQVVKVEALEKSKYNKQRL